MMRLGYPTERFGIFGEDRDEFNRRCHNDDQRCYRGRRPGSASVVKGFLLLVNARPASIGLAGRDDCFNKLHAQ